MDQVRIFAEIILINILLSGDNALVIAMASQRLPDKQRKQAIWWGSFAAIGLRCGLIFVALQLLQIPFLQAIGALLLIYIAIKLLLDVGGRHRERLSVRKAATLGFAIWTIVAADFIMSLDNVLAVAAVAGGDIKLILLGIALSIPMIIWGSQLLSSLLSRFFWLTYLGSGLLAYTGGQMLVKDPGLSSLIFEQSQALSELIPLLCVPLAVVISILSRRFQSEV